MRKIGLNEIYGRIFRGAFPALYHEEPPELQDFYRSYVNTYLQRDIRDLSQVADESVFYNFMIIVAARTAKPVIYEEIANRTILVMPDKYSKFSKIFLFCFF